MKIEVDEDGIIVSKEVYSGVVLETAEGNRMAICMRDDGFEISLIGEHISSWHATDFNTGTINKSSANYIQKKGDSVEDLIDGLTREDRDLLFIALGESGAITSTRKDLMDNPNERITLSDSRDLIRDWLIGDVGFA